MPYTSAYPSKCVLDMVRPKGLPEGGDRAAIHILPKWTSDDLEDLQSIPFRSVCSRSLRRDPILYFSFLGSEEV